MDNLPVHHTEVVREALAAVDDAKLVFLPPYSPDLSPIELCWSRAEFFKAETFKQFADSITITLTCTLSYKSDKQVGGTIAYLKVQLFTVLHFEAYLGFKNSNS